MAEVIKPEKLRIVRKFWQPSELIKEIVPVYQVNKLAKHVAKGKKSIK